ncbi:hypothetical protein Tco_1480118 [Tanacetum coccineum]
MLPSSLLPPLPVSLFIPPLVDRREDIPKAELPHRKRLCLTAPTSRYEVGESLTAAPRPTRGHRADYGFIGTMGAEIRRQRAEEASYGIRDVWVDPTKAVEEEQDTQDIYAVIEDTQDRQTQLFQRVDGLDSYLDAGLSYRLTGVTDDNIDCIGAVIAALRVVAAVVVAATPMTVAAVEQLIKARVYNSETGIKGTVRTPRECTYKDFLNCKTLTFKGTEGVVVLSQWFEKMESMFHISNCAMENQVEFATCTFLGNAGGTPT